MEKYFDINENGYSIRCKLYTKDIHNIEKAVIFCHGFGGHKDNRAAARFAEYILAKYKNTAMVVFDWPCHGMDARKKLVLSECLMYLDMVKEYTLGNLGAKELYVYATSFGGFLTMRYIAEHGNPFKKIALRCPAIGMGYVLVNIMTEDEKAKLEKGKEILIGFDRKVKVRKEFFEELQQADIMNMDFMDYADDILIIHGTEDEIVPYSTSEEFSEKNVIELVPIEGADHRFRDPKKLDAAHQFIVKFFNF